MESFIGQIMVVGFNFAPRGWAICEGQLLEINRHTALFSLLGTTFGGDGRTTFGLPDLRGRSIVGVGNGPGIPEVRWGQRFGNATTTLTEANLPSHTHAVDMNLSPGPGLVGQGNDVFLSDVSAGETIFSSVAPNNMSNKLAAGAVTASPTGNSQSFGNYPPSLGLFCHIALIGIFPSRN